MIETEDVLLVLGVLLLAVACWYAFGWVALLAYLGALFLLTGFVMSWVRAGRG